MELTGNAVVEYLHTFTQMPSVWSSILQGWGVTTRARPKGQENSFLIKFGKLGD